MPWAMTGAVPVTFDELRYQDRTFARLALRLVFRPIVIIQRKPFQQPGPLLCAGVANLDNFVRRLVVRAGVGAGVSGNQNVRLFACSQVR